MTEEWSPWLDFDNLNVESVPESSGVFVMHASMKVLYIGASENIRTGLKERRTDDCCSKAKRFRYILAQSPDIVKENLLKDYAEKHAGMKPVCNSQ